jgi:hypothetical protein
VKGRKETYTKYKTRQNNNNKNQSYDLEVLTIITTELK